MKFDKKGWQWRLIMKADNIPSRLIHNLGLEVSRQLFSRSWLSTLKSNQEFYWLLILPCQENECMLRFLIDFWDCFWTSDSLPKHIKTKVEPVKSLGEDPPFIFFSFSLFRWLLNSQFLSLSLNKFETGNYFIIYFIYLF
jgi:hypothetical protein